MGFFALLNHAINFVAPAAWLALLMPLLGRLIIKKRSVALTLLAQAAIYFVVGVVMLLIGLALFGRDGKMLTYLALVVSITTSQWLMHKGWRV
jgi:hypothetical protein